MITKFTLTLLLVLLTVLTSFSQKLNWTSTSAGNQQFGVQVSEHVWDVEATNTNIVVAGYITGASARFGDIVMPTENTSNLSEYYNYLANYDANGKALWVKRLSSIYQTDIAIDADKNIWVAFTDDISRAFIRKYSQSGDLLLEKQIQIDADIELTSISLDNNQSVLLTGLLHATKNTITVEGKSFTGIKGDSYMSYAMEGFIMKYTKDHVFEWIALTKGSDLCLINDVQVDSNNNIILVGEFATESGKQLQFGSDIKLSGYPNYSVTYTSGFIAKVSAGGNFMWADNIRSQSDSWANGLAINHLNEIQVVGSFVGKATLKDKEVNSKGDIDVFLTKLDTNGNVLWLESAGGNYASGLGDVGRSIANDRNGNIFISGAFTSSATFGEGEAAVVLNTSYAHDKGGFVAQYTSDGAIVWAEKVNGTTGSKAEALEVAVNGTTLYVSGNFYQNVSVLDTNLPVAYANMDHVFLTSIDFSSTVTSLPELHQSDKYISVYPNPTTSSLKLDVKQPIGKIQSLQIVGSTGQVVHVVQNFTPDQTINLSVLPAGFYNLILQTDRYIINRKIIKK